MLKRIYFSLIALALFAACEENAEILKVKSEISPNEIQALTSDNFVLSQDDATETFQQFRWTAPDFGFPAAISYRLQIDLADNNFSSPVDVLTSNATSASVTIGDFNKKLLDLGLAPDETAEVQVRVVSTVNTKVAPVYSTPRTFAVTPYATDFPPYYMIGDATGGWDLAMAVEIRSVGPSKYETTAEFTNGGKFRFFASPSWSAAQYNWSTFEGGSIDPKLENGQDNDGNFLFTGESGWYKITADVRNKTITLADADRPALYMIGGALQGWELAKAVELTRIKDGLFSITTTFTGNEIFRFFTKPDWDAGTINYPYFEGGDIDALLANANDNDGNFKFVGQSGEYTITVDLYNLTIEMEVPVEPEPIYMIGDATGGWTLEAAVELAPLGAKKWEGVATFTNGGKFRFFTQPDWGAVQYRWADFEGGSVDTKLDNGEDGDGNFLFDGPSGSYKISVNLQTKIIVLEPQ